MNESTSRNAAKAASKKGQKPAHTVRRGAVAANIWLRQTQTGFHYYDFSLSRSWKSQSSEKQGYSNNFFPKNEEQLVEVIQEASQWITAQMEAVESAVSDAA